MISEWMDIEEDFIWMRAVSELKNYMTNFCFISFRSDQIIYSEFPTSVE